MEKKISWNEMKNKFPNEWLLIVDYELDDLPGVKKDSIDKTYVKAYLLREVNIMKTLTATKAREELYKLLDEASSSHEPIQITGKRSNAVLISIEDWKAIQETLYLLSIPGMRESIREGLETPLEKCKKELDW